MKMFNGITRCIGKAKFGAKKHSPEILVVTGVVGVVTAAVMACKATAKATKIVEETKETMVDIHENEEDYNEQELQKTTTLVYSKAGFEIAKLYAPSVLIGAASIACIFASHKIISKRYVATASALAAVNQDFKDYRGRVVDRFGEQLDRELRYNIKSKEVEETIVDENGKEKKVKKTVEVYDPTAFDKYSRIYAEGCNGHTKSPEHNLNYLLNVQNSLNDTLKRRGHIFLNEVYDALGFRRTEAGGLAGWIYEENDPTTLINFGIWDCDNQKAIEFVNGDEYNFLIEFRNINPNILGSFEQEYNHWGIC